MAQEDLSITLGLDDRALVQALQTLTSQVSEMTGKMQSSFSSLGDNIASQARQVTPVTDAFTSLAGVVAGLASVNKLVGFTSWANDLTQVAQAVGFTTGEMAALQTSVVQAGGTAKAASQGIEMFYMKLDQARQGGAAQQYAFERLGISMKDLRDIDDKTLFANTIDALARLPAGAERNRIEVELLSRSFRGVPLNEISENLKEATGKFDELTPVLDAAGSAYRRLQQDQTAFKLATLEILTPLLTAFANFKISIDDARTALKAILDIIIVIAAVKFALILFEMVDAFVAFVKIIREANIALQTFAILEQVATLGVGSIIQMLVKLGIAGAGVYGVVEATKALNDMIDKNVKTYQEAGAAANAKAEADRKATGSTPVLLAGQRLIEMIRGQTQAFEENIAMQIRQIQTAGDNADQSNETRARLAEELKVRDEFTRKVQELQTRLKEAQNAPGGSEARNTVSALKTSIDQLTLAQAGYTAAAGNAAAERAREIDQTKMLDVLAKDRISIDKTIADIQTNIDELSLTNNEKKIAQIQRQTAEYIKMATEQRRAQLGPQVSDADLNQDAVLQKTIKGIRDKQTETVTATRQEISASQDWSTAWNTAFKQYAEDAGNSATQARRVFDDMTKGMEDTLVGFFKTGKLDWQSFLATIIEDLLRSQIKQTIAQVFSRDGSGSAGGGLAGFFKGILGFATGGNIPAGQTALVGESGPELITGPTQVTPLTQFNAASAGSSGASTTVNYNINAVDAASFQSMLAANPQFLYAVTEQGRMSLPLNRR